MVALRGSFQLTSGNYKYVNRSLIDVADVKF